MTTPPEGLWGRIRAARLPEILGVYAGASYALLQAVDMFVERLGLPDWTFVGALLLVLGGVPVLLLTAFAAIARKSTLFTWRNALRSGVGAMAVLALAVGAFMAMRALGIGPVGTLVAAGVLDARGRILIADFQSQTGDNELAGAVTEAFRIDFEQSPIVRVLDAGKVSAALERMQRPMDTRLTPDVAREIALREGVPAYVTGEINRAGRTFVLSVRLSGPGEAGVLVSLRETARDSASIIEAVDRLSSRLRERIGESLRTIRAGEPLEQVSTPSLQALNLYSQAVSAIDHERDQQRGVALLEEAIALDSTFAMALRKLGVTLSNIGAPRERWAPVLTRAYQNAARLPVRERYHAQASYYSTVENDSDRAIAAYRSLLELYPDDGTALNNLAIRLAARGDRAGATELYERALAADSTVGLRYTNLVVSRADLGRWEAADSLLTLYQARFPNHTEGDVSRATLEAARGRYTAADSIFTRLQSSTNPSIASNAMFNVGMIALLHGRVAEALDHLADGADHAQGAGLDVGDFSHKLLVERVRVEIEGDTAGALARIDAMLRATPLTAADAASGIHLGAAAQLAMAGRPDRARTLLAQWDSVALDEQLRAAFAESREETEIIARLFEGRTDDVIAYLNRKQRTASCPSCYNVGLAIAYDIAGRPDSVIAYFERYINDPWFFRFRQDAFMLPRAHERTAQLYDARGDTERAVEHYTRFVELWKDADPVLAPRVDTARRRLVTLTAGLRDP